jgi:hypothetical protein
LVVLLQLKKNALPGLRRSSFGIARWYSIRYFED